MDRHVNLVCNRGEAVASTKFTHLYGHIVEFQNLGALTDNAPRDYRSVQMMFVKNGSGGALLPGQLVAWKTGQEGKHVTNPAATTGVLIAGVVDHLLPAAGVADGQGFLMTILGPTKFLNDAAGAISEFDKLVNSSSVAGCVRVKTAAPAQGAELAQVNGLVGYAAAAAVAGGGTLANATSFWGYFTGPFIG
jgi:hypothetical protein